MKLQISGLAHIGIPSSDVKKSIDFYRKLGFEVIVEKYSLEGHNFVFMENQGVILGFPESLEDEKNGAGCRGAGAIDHIALNCHDLDEAYNIVKHAGLLIVSEISETAVWEPRKCRCFMIEGPDNVRIEFVEISD